MLLTCAPPQILRSQSHPLQAWSLSLTATSPASGARRPRAPCARKAPHLAEVPASLKDTRKHVRHRGAPVSFQSRPVGPRGAQVVGSLFLPTVASTAAEPGDNSRQVRTAMDHRSSTRPMPDNAGWRAHSCGSDAPRGCCVPDLAVMLADTNQQTGGRIVHAFVHET